MGSIGAPELIVVGIIGLLVIGLPVGVILLVLRMNRPSTTGLIPCRSCGRPVSPRAAACPQCGEPIARVG